MMVGKIIPTDNTKVGWETCWRKSRYTCLPQLRSCLSELSGDTVVKTKPDESSHPLLASICIQQENAVAFFQKIASLC